jgi:hypothetical protein
MARPGKPKKVKADAKRPLVRRAPKDHVATVRGLQKRLGETREQLQARDRELAEALEQQTATSEILQVISTSPTDVNPALEAVVEAATRLCAATDAVIFLDALVGVLHVPPVPGRSHRDIELGFGHIDPDEMFRGRHRSPRWPVLARCGLVAGRGDCAGLVEGTSATTPAPPRFPCNPGGLGLSRPSYTVSLSGSASIYKGAHAVEERGGGRLCRFASVEKNLGHLVTEIVEVAASA